MSIDDDRGRPRSVPDRPTSKDGTVSVLPLDGRRLAVPSRPLLFRTDGTVENTDLKHRRANTQGDA